MLNNIVGKFALVCGVALLPASLCNFFALDSERSVVHFYLRSASGEEVCDNKEKSMRLKLVLAALISLSTLPVFSQVAPAVKIGGLPLGIGGGLSDYSLDWGPGRRMIGASAWADYNIFHGVGIEAEGTTIFADRPAVLPRMR